MEILIVILIVVMIAQSVLFIYSNFIDLSNKRKEASIQEQIKDMYVDFAHEKMILQDALLERNKRIEELGKELNTRGIQLQAALARLREHKDDDGYAVGRKDAIEKAYEWLEENLPIYWSQINANNTKEFIDKFKKAMEE